MKLPRWTHSLKWRIVASYSLILIVGGVSTSVIGIRVTDQALLKQARQQVEHALSATRAIYRSRLHELAQTVELLATSGRVRECLRELDGTSTVGGVGGAGVSPASDYLASIRRRNRLDFLSVADATGRTVLRTAGPGDTGDRVADLAPIAQALTGKPAAGTELVPLTILRAENPALAERAGITAVPGPDGTPGSAERLEAGLVLLAAAPVRNQAGRIIGVLYAGQLLNHTSTAADPGGAHAIVDQMRDTLFHDLRSQGRHAGAATIFQDDIRISTNVLTAQGRRAVGTRVSREVYEAVMIRGGTWNDRAFAVSDWYITAYEPLSNLAGQRIGILGVGLLQHPYTAVRDYVTLMFAGIALFCFVLIVVVTYFLTRGLMRPLEEMVAVSKEIAAGDLSHRVQVEDQSELGLLSSSFNAMLDRIDEMNTERYGLLEQHAEQWTQTLEQKVRERTEQLAKTQAALGRQQRLASLGQLAAGVAHEINNPLGGILTFASLVLEEIPPDSPLREDVEEIVSQADRCRKIVQELLEFSRQRQARTAPASLNEVLSRTLALLEKQASFHDIRIVRELDPDLPVTVIDESQMQQVFMNIILNAADAMDGRGTLTINTGHHRDRNEVFVRISDTGCGIPKNIREAIFDPFFTTKDPGKGTGLGLSVVCRIVQSHGGRLEVDSEIGQGTTFTIILPLPAGTAVTDTPPDADE